MHELIPMCLPTRIFTRNKNQPLRLTLLLTMALLTGCASSGQLAEVESRTIDGAPQTGAQNTSIQNTSIQSNSRPNNTADARISNIERAQFYLQVARDTESASHHSDLVYDAYLSAAENFIQANDYQRAQQSIANLKPSQLTPTQNDRYSVIAAYVAYQNNDYAQALRELTDLLSRPIALTPNTTSAAQVDALLLSSFCYQALNDYDATIEVLARREQALSGQARTESARYTAQVIQTLSLAQRQQLINTTDQPIVRHKLTQSINGTLDHNAMTPSQFTQWRAQQVHNRQVIASAWGASAPRSIAVLLPLSSRFAQAAHALRAGIEHAHAENSSVYRPDIDFYDIGNDPLQASLYYQAALNNGVDTVLGPLGKEYANEIARHLLDNRQQAYTPTILLGGDSDTLADKTMRFSLNPTLEGVHIAEKAFADGHVSAAILHPNKPSAVRSAQAFTQRWLQLGGKVTQQTTYSAEQFDHRSKLRQLFALEQSEYRHRRLSALLGSQPKFSAYQRSDIDFIFLIADNDAGRIVRPQINFFSSSQLPVYATSSIYDGIENATDNLDLEDTIFPVMPWTLQSIHVAAYAGQLNRIFALGSDAYTLAGNWQALRNNTDVAIKGKTGRIYITPSGDVAHRPIWATFKEGRAHALDNLGYDLHPIEKPAELEDHSLETNENWDSGQ